MIQHLQIERIADLIVPAGQNLIFDNVISTGGDKISYDMLTGEIEFTKEGVYYISWFAAQQTGLSPAGSNFGIRNTAVGSDETIIASNHVKISSTSGFAIISVPTEGKTVSLVNETAHGATLSETVLVKAGLAVFEVSEGAAPVTEAIGFIHVQNVEEAIEIDIDGKLIFDTTISQDSNDIVEYDDVTGIFTIHSEGIFSIAWQIPINATDTSPDVTMALYIDDVSHSSYYMPLPIGVISGSAVIQVGEESVDIHLQNSSGNIIRVTPNANLTITQLS